LNVQGATHFALLNPHLYDRGKCIAFGSEIRSETHSKLQ
jgi:hypothetical protein